MIPNLCLELSELPFGIKLYQYGPDNFTVCYGLQSKGGLTYVEATKQLGECILHALACAGRLDNRAKEEE